MSLQDLFLDYNIPFTTEGKNCKPGWINVCCPFCDDMSNHLGINMKSFAGHCWRCSDSFSPLTIIMRLCGVSFPEAKEIQGNYKEEYVFSTSPYDKPDERRFQPKEVPFPADTDPVLRSNHLHYLKKRKFDVEELREVWKIQGTGLSGYLDGIDYRFRLFVPIFWERKLVSFQTRDVTGVSKMRYLACPKKHEIIHHKDIIYCHPTITNIGICVEGITDVWRLGIHAFATFGIEFTQKQIREIAKKFQKVFLMYDNEGIASRQANRLRQELLFRDVEVVDISHELGKKDPAELSDKKVKKLLRKYDIQ